MALYAIFIRAGQLSSPFLRTGFDTFASVQLWRVNMDIVFLAGIALLWGVMALLVWGFRKLERPQGARP